MPQTGSFTRKLASPASRAVESAWSWVVMLPPYPPGVCSQDPTARSRRGDRPAHHFLRDVDQPATGRPRVGPHSLEGRLGRRARHLSECTLGLLDGDPAVQGTLELFGQC